MLSWVCTILHLYHLEFFNWETVVLNNIVNVQANWNPVLYPFHIRNLSFARRMDHKDPKDSANIYTPILILYKKGSQTPVPITS